MTSSPLLAILPSLSLRSLYLTFSLMSRTGDQWGGAKHPDTSVTISTLRLNTVCETECDGCQNEERFRVSWIKKEREGVGG